MRDVLETVRKHSLSLVGVEAPNNDNKCTSVEGDDDELLVENLLKGLRQQQQQESEDQPKGRNKNATLTGDDSNELTDFERAVLSKYIRELNEIPNRTEEPATLLSPVESNQTKSDESIGSTTAQFDENGNALIAENSTVAGASEKHPDFQQEQQHEADVSSHPKVVMSTKATTNNAATPTTSTSCSSNAITRNTTSCIAANNSELIEHHPAKSEQSGTVNVSLAEGANANDHNRVVSLPGCKITTTSATNDDGAERIVITSPSSTSAAGTSVNSNMAGNERVDNHLQPKGVEAEGNDSMGQPKSSPAIISASTVVAAAAVDGNSNTNTTMARAAMAAIRDRAMRRKFSVWVGVTSCVWGLLLYLIKTYT